MQFTIELDDELLGDVTNEDDLREAAHQIAESVANVYGACAIHTHRALPMKPAPYFVVHEDEGRRVRVVKL